MFGFEWECDGLLASSTPTPSRQAATDALVARMDVPPDAARVAAIDQVIATLGNAGIWGKLDLLLVLAAHHPQAALLNWKGASYSATTMGAPVFVADRGFFTDGSDDAIDWAWSPANGSRSARTPPCSARGFVGTTATPHRR